MIISMKPGTKKERINQIKSELEQKGAIVSIVEGEQYTILGLIGDLRTIDEGEILAKRDVEKVMHVQEPFKKSNRMFHPEDSIITVGNQQIGGGSFSVMAGPCSVESEAQIVGIAKEIKDSGANFLRGGAFKPRTSPYSFQGLMEDGIELLKIASEKTQLPIVSEIMSVDRLDTFIENVDIIQIGARNMQNFELLKAVGKTNKAILLKRGLSATIEEWLMSAEYIMSEGNENVILCERGIRTFETYTRNTLDLSAIPIIKKLSHLPIIVDPSHATGHWWLVEPLAKAAMAVGADGIMVEVHNDPENAKCDGQQSIKPKKFDELMKKLRVLEQAIK